MRPLPRCRSRLLAVPRLVPGLLPGSLPGLVVVSGLFCALARPGVVLGAPGLTDAGALSVRPLDAREVVVPIPGAERLRIDNPLGNVTIRAWDRPGAVHIIAEKQSASPEALTRLRVHFTAWAGGEISLETRVEMGGREKAMPLAASRIDLVVEVPPDLEIEAKTFAGDLSATGLRSGAHLETTGGRIGVSDVHGRVVTHQLRGGQTLVDIDGDVDVDGVEGHMQLERLAGARVEARVVDGDIRAEDIRSDEVRLSATTGQVILVGVLRPRAHYDLRSYGGDVHLAIIGAPSGFELRARSPLPITSTSIKLRTLWREGDRLRAAAPPMGASTAAERAQTRPIVELSSLQGRVVLEPAPLLVDRPRTDGLPR